MRTETGSLISSTVPPNSEENIQQTVEIESSYSGIPQRMDASVSLAIAPASFSPRMSPRKMRFLSSSLPP